MHSKMNTRSQMMNSPSVQCIPADAGQISVEDTSHWISIRAKGLNSPNLYFYKMSITSIQLIYFKLIGASIEFTAIITFFFEYFGFSVQRGRK